MSEKILSPSILAFDNCRISDGIEIINNSHAKWIHIDVMDGQFVPNITFGQNIVSGIKRITDRILDIHLMVQHPLDLIESFVSAGANMITFHYESLSDIKETILFIKSVGCKVGLSINPKTAVTKITKFLKFLDFVLIMSVEPGKCGQPFIVSSCEKLKFLKNFRESAGLSYRIAIDGGINPETFQLANSAGADIFIVGSSFFSNLDFFKKSFPKL